MVRICPLNPTPSVGPASLDALGRLTPIDFEVIMFPAINLAACDQLACPLSGFPWSCRRFGVLTRTCPGWSPSRWEKAKVSDSVQLIGGPVQFDYDQGDDE